MIGEGAVQFARLPYGGLCCGGFLGGKGALKLFIDAGGDQAGSCGVSAVAVLCCDSPLQVGGINGAAIRKPRQRTF